MSYILVEYSTDDFGSGIFESITPMTNDAGTKIEIFKSEQDALKVLYDLQSSVPDIYDYDMDISVERIH
tara:strand:- start:423 stop:629 length:207 start_codon:yes stop_codon:yes gene_type:complete